MSILSLVAIAIGLLVFLFVFWNHLKEDVRSNSIFTAGFMVVIGCTLAIGVGTQLDAKWWFWSAFGGAVVGGLLAFIKEKIRFFEMLDAWVLGLVWMMSEFALVWFFAAPTRDSFLFALLAASAVWAIRFFDRNYKKFTWYRGAKMGFVGLGTITLYFTLRAAVGIPAHDMVFYAGKSDWTISGLTALICLLVLWKRSRRL